MRHSKRWVLFLLGVYLAVFAVCAVSPVDRMTWWAESATVWVFVGWVALLYRRGVRFSNAAYARMALFFCLYTVGGHYTFSEVPFGWVWQRRVTSSRGLAYLVGWLGVVALAGLFEWLYAEATVHLACVVTWLPRK